MSNKGHVRWSTTQIDRQGARRGKQEERGGNAARPVAAIRLRTHQAQADIFAGRRATVAGGVQVQVKALNCAKTSAQPQPTKSAVHGRSTPLARPVASQIAANETPRKVVIYCLHNYL